MPDEIITQHDEHTASKSTPWYESGWRYLWLVLLVILCDQASKGWALDHLQPHVAVAVMPLFNMTLTFNPGAAFSFLGDQDGWQRWFFILLAAMVSIALLVWLRSISAHQWRLASALVLIMGGAIGNVIDRILYHHVIDFLDFYWGIWHYPTFNVADIAITLGALLLLWDAWVVKKSSTTN